MTVPSPRRGIPEWVTWVGHRVPSVLLILGGIAVAVYLVIRSAQPSPPSIPEIAILSIFSSVLNVVGGVVFGRIGRANPAHARSAVRRLITIGNQLAGVLRDLSSAQASAPEAELVMTVKVSAKVIQAVTRQLGDAVQDWNDVHREALREVLQGNEQLYTFEPRDDHE